MEAEIREFSLRLEETTIRNERLRGQVYLDLSQPLLNIRSLQIRFVGGIKTTHKQLVGYSKLFDSKITLSEKDRLQGENVFDFELVVPPGPNSISTPDIQVEYLLLCVLGFQNGCCGLFPVLQRNPVTIKQQLHIVSTSLLETFESRLGYDLEMLDSYLIWNPQPFLLVKMEPIQTIDDWYFRLQLDLDYSIEKVDYSLYEQSLFKYDMDTQSRRLVQLEKDGKKCICKGSLVEFPVGTIVDNERQYELGLHLLLETSFMDITPDIHCNVAVVTHLLKLDCFIRSKGQSVSEKITGILHIQVYPRHDNPILVSLDSQSTLIIEPDQEKEEGLRKRK